MNEAVAEVGNANYAGVQNVSPLRMRRLIHKLDAYGLILTTNAFEFSLTNRKKEKWIQACKALGVIPLIQNPFDGGLASAQYTATNPSGGIAGAAKYPFSKLEKLQPLHSVLETVAQRIATRVKRELGDAQDRSKGRYGKMVRSVE
jgi:aryl-alcohol dehydrogenase-like predicted oxidoreductase